MISLAAVEALAPLTPLAAMNGERNAGLQT
jgi:hypothetical protein